MPAILAYWDLRGLVQPTKFLLEYTQTPYEDKIYILGGAPDYDTSSWTDEKFNLGLGFPNLPYFIDGDIKLTQSSAILRYIARKHDLCGKTETEKAQVDMLDLELIDFRTAYGKLCYDPNFEALKAEFLKKLPAKLKEFSEYLGDRDWLVGDSITYVDFMAYEYLDVHRVLEPTCLKDFKNLEDYLTRFEKLDRIAAYMKTPAFIKFPINGTMASFGGGK